MGAAPTPTNTFSTAGGRAPALPELSRDRPLSMRVSRGDEADLRTIAETWDVPVATAAYGLLAQQLGIARGQCTRHAPSLSLGLAAAIDLLRANGWTVSRGNSVRESGPSPSSSPHRES